MVMSILWIGLVAASIVFSLLTGSGSALSAAVSQGAQSGVTLAISIAGSLCLWSGVSRLMEKTGVTAKLACGLRPFLTFVFPESRGNPALAQNLSANICANFLGLGNAATPVGIQAAKALCSPDSPSTATDGFCRLVVLNTASIQAIPTTVAALRAGLGSASAYDILPAVWFTSILSAGAGLCTAWCLGKLWPHG